MAKKTVKQAYVTPMTLDIWAQCAAPITMKVWDGVFTLPVTKSEKGTLGWRFTALDCNVNVNGKVVPVKLTGNGIWPTKEGRDMITDEDWATMTDHEIDIMGVKIPLRKTRAKSGNRGWSILDDNGNVSMGYQFNMSMPDGTPCKLSLNGMGVWVVGSKKLEA